MVLERGRDLLPNTADYGLNVEAMKPCWQLSAPNNPLTDFMSSMAAVNPIGRQSSWMIASPGGGAWRAALGRWATPPIATSTAQYAGIDWTISEALQPIVSRAAAQAMRDAYGQPLADMQVQVQTMWRMPDLNLPSIEVPLPNTTVWPDELPYEEPPLLSESEFEHAGSGVAPSSGRLTKEDVEEIVGRKIEEGIRRALEKQKRPILVKIGKRLVEAYILKVVVENTSTFNVEEYVVRIVVDGAAHFLPYLH